MGIQAWEPRVVQGSDNHSSDNHSSDNHSFVDQSSNVQASETLVHDVLANDEPRQALKETLRKVVSSNASPVGAASVATASTITASAKAQSTAEAELPPMLGEEPPLPTDEYMPSLDMSEVMMSSTPAVPAIDVSTLDWPALELAVSACTACELHQSRTQTVCGVGSRVAEWMVIGEAPGAEEDQQGEPFVGPSGKLLNNMLRALGLQREQVFISNILKCRPPEDRDPLPAEISQCEPYLQRQIELVAPKVILAMGAVAAHHLLQVDTAVTKLRGQLHHYGQTPLVVTYHPAYLLRKPSEKAKSWADLRFAASVVNGSVSGAVETGENS
jgi:DNA polymerase